MPRFYFHIKGEGHSCPDLEGVELPDPHAARDYALEEARGLVQQCVWDIKDPARWWIEITDDLPEPLFRVRLSEAEQAAPS